MPRRRVSSILGLTLAFTLAIALSLQLAPPHSASANGGITRPDINIDPEPMIKACWDLSEELRASPSTADQRNGSADTLECLKNLLLDQLGPLFAGQGSFTFPKSDRRLDREGFNQTLDDLIRAYGGFYWAIYNDNAACDPGCGTIWYTIHLSATNRMLQEMIRSVVGLRNDYDL